MLKHIKSGNTDKIIATALHLSYILHYNDSRNISRKNARFCQISPKELKKLQKQTKMLKIIFKLVACYGDDLEKVN